MGHFDRHVCRFIQLSVGGGGQSNSWSSLWRLELRDEALARPSISVVLFSAFVDGTYESIFLLVRCRS